MRRHRRLVSAALAGAAAVVATFCGSAGAITTVEYRAGITQGPAGDIASIAAGPDGAIWFTGQEGIGRMTVDGASRSAFPLGPTAGTPLALVSGPDGALWFPMAFTGSTIGRMTIAGAVTLFTPSYRGGSQPQDMTSGPDGALWYTEPGLFVEPEHPSAGRFFGGVVRVTTVGAFTPFPLRADLHPSHIAAGPDRALWFTAPGSRTSIGRLTTSGRYTLFDARVPRDHPIGDIVAGPDGNLWYSIGGGLVGRMTRSGRATIFHTASTDPTVGDLAVGPDGDVWMTAERGGIVKIVPPRGRCIVPRLVGLRFATATARLHRARCTIGRVVAPRSAHRARLVVRRQSPRRGTRLPAESAVDLTLRR